MINYNSNGFRLSDDEHFQTYTILGLAPPEMKGSFICDPRRRATHHQNNSFKTRTLWQSN